MVRARTPANDARRPASSFEHVVLDMTVPDTGSLGVEATIKIMREAARKGNLNIIKVQSHQFAPNGFTAVALLSQSHIAIHTWPEYNYVSCDIFSCGGDMTDLIDHIVASYAPTKVANQLLPRGPPSGVHFNSIYIDETGPGIRTKLDVQVLANIHSDFQHIQVFQHPAFGRMLVIEDDVQFAESDHDVYDEALMSPLKSNGRGQKVLIIGGGDGLCCSYLLKNDLASSIELLELDPAVPRTCLKYFPKISSGIADRKVHINYGDAVKSIREMPPGTYDSVIIDSTDADSEWGKTTYSQPFLKQAKRALRNGGILCMNGTSATYTYALSADEIGANVKAVFGNVATNTSWIPSFGSPWSLFSARR